MFNLLIAELHPSSHKNIHVTTNHKYSLTPNYTTDASIELLFLCPPSVGPEILEPPGNLTVVFPEDSVFTCRATGLPRPAITWWAGGVLLTSGSKFNINTEPLVGDREVSSNLTVLGAAPNDATVYTCLAENIVDSAEEDVKLIVHGELRILV